MKNNPSQEQLTKSLDRRIRHLMIRTLERFEDSFPDLDDTKEGQIFKGDIRNAFNDVLRAQRDEVRDYEVDYRPLRMNEDNTLSMTQTFMQTVQKIDFGIRSEPFLTISASIDKRGVLDAIRSELNAGVICEEDGYIVLEIVGIEPCINSVIPILDRYRLHADVRAKYKTWRGQVVKLYRR